LPELLAAVVIIKKQDSQLNFHIALANDELLEWAKVLADKVNVPISIGDAHQQATRSDLVLVASGTAALELALLGVPMVVVYKLSAMSYWIAKRLVTIAYVSLPNIIAGE
jgi:lipid-A-disaccharide synthase